MLGTSDVESTEPKEQEDNRGEKRRRVQADSQASIDGSDIIQDRDRRKRNHFDGVGLINLLPNPHTPQEMPQ